MSCCAHKLCHWVRTLHRIKKIWNSMTFQSLFSFLKCRWSPRLSFHICHLVRVFQVSRLEGSYWITLAQKTMEVCKKVHCCGHLCSTQVSLASFSRTCCATDRPCVPDFLAENRIRQSQNSIRVLRHAILKSSGINTNSLVMQLQDTQMVFSVRATNCAWGLFVKASCCSAWKLMCIL